MAQETLIRPGLWARRVQLPAIKKSLRAKVPQHAYHENEKKPFTINTIDYLYQNGFQKSAALIEDLLEAEQHFITGKMVFSCLTTSKKLLLELSEILRDIEAEEATAFDLVIFAIKLKKGSITCKWLAAQLFKYALDLCSKGQNDYGYLEAKIRFAYAECLLENNMEDVATEILEVAYDLAVDKPWFSLTPHRTLIKDINYLLCLGYMRRAENIRRSDLKLATLLSKKAVKNALEADKKCAPGKAYLIRGKLAMDNEDYENGLSYFHQAMHYSQYAKIDEDICEADLSKALCLNKLGQVNRAMKCIRLARSRAVAKGLPLYLGKSHMLIAENNMAKGNYGAASANYVEALQVFKKSDNDESELLARKMRCLSGYAYAISIFNVYFKLLQEIFGPEGQNYFKRLILWKEKRTPFWDAKHGRYQLLGPQVGFYDEYKVDTFVLVDGKLIFASHMQDEGSSWRKPVSVPFAKRQLLIFDRTMHDFFIGII